MESDEKTCPRCAASLDCTAKTCARCGFDFVTGLESGRYMFTVADKAKRFGCLKLTGLILIVIGVAGIAGHLLGFPISRWW